LEACRREGIDPSELVQRKIDYIKNYYDIKELPQEDEEYMLSHFEERRQEKINIVVEVKSFAVFLKYQYRVYI
jgi:hypothetical protein